MRATSTTRRIRDPGGAPAGGREPGRAARRGAPLETPDDACIEFPALADAPPVLALGADLKPACCMLQRGRARLHESPAPLTDPRAYRAYVRQIERLIRDADPPPRFVAHDLHPQYESTRLAARLAELGVQRIGVQHHHAHVASLMAECSHVGPVVGIACDGTGHGTDGAAWGCELLLCRRAEVERLGRHEYFPLVGGDLAAVETWRPAAALLSLDDPTGWSKRAARLFASVPRDALANFERQLARRLNAPLTSSLGRLFDAVAFLTGLCPRNLREGVAAMALEAAAADEPVEPYPFRVRPADGAIEMSLRPAVEAVAADVLAGEPTARIAARFHETVARMLARGAASACERSDARCVGLTGGCFNNRRLRRRLTELLAAEHITVLMHRRVPCGDGGVALGQAVVAAFRVLDESRAGRSPDASAPVSSGAHADARSTRGPHPAPPAPAA